MAPDVAEIHRFPPSEQTRKNNDESWSIYPNPASGQIMLKINTDRVLDYHLYDALGRYMKSGNYVRGDSLDVGDMRAGVYYLQLNEREKQRGTKRLIILE